MRQFDPNERPSAYAAENALRLIGEALTMIAQVVIDEPQADRDTFLHGGEGKFRDLMNCLLDARTKAASLAGDFSLDD